MESSEEYFVNHDGETSGPFGLEKVREKLHSGQFKSDDLIVAEGDTQWLPLSEVIQINELHEIPVEDEQTTSASSNHLKVSRGLGVAAVCLFLLTLLITLVFLGTNIWVATQITEGSFEAFEKRVLLFTIIVPFFWIILLGAKICLICADRSYISRVVLGLLLGFVAFHSIIDFTRYLCWFPLQNWLSNHVENLGLIYWLFSAVLVALYSLFVFLLLIKRKWSYRIVLLLSLVVCGGWEIINLILWGLSPGVLPDIFENVFGFMEPIREWLDENRVLRSILYWIFTTFIPLVSYLVLAVPLAFGKSTRPEPEFT